MNSRNNYNYYPNLRARRPVPVRPRLMGVLSPPPIPTPPPMPGPNHCGMSEESAQCAVEQLKTLNFTRSENVWLALIAGGFFGYWLGKGK